MLGAIKKLASFQGGLDKGLLAGAAQSDSPFGRAMQIGTAAMTGGAGKAALTLASQKNPRIGALASAGDAIGGMFGGGSPAPSAPKGGSPWSLGANTDLGYGGGAIGRRLSTMSQTPDFAIDQGLSALMDPAVPDAVRQGAVRPLLAAKKFGARGAELYGPGF